MVARADLEHCARQEPHVGEPHAVAGDAREPTAGDAIERLAGDVELTHLRAHPHGRHRKSRLLRVLFGQRLEQFRQPMQGTALHREKHVLHRVRDTRRTNADTLADGTCLLAEFCRRVRSPASDSRIVR